MKEMKYQAEQKIEVLDTGNFFGLEYYILNLGTHPAAYIKIPEGHELYQKAFDEIDLDIHGGITYSRSYLYLAEDKKIDGWFIGWDYGHCGDYANYYTEDFGINLKKWTTQKIQDEVEEACYQIQKMEEIKKLKQARSCILRGNDIESAALILEKCVLDNYIIKGGRENILKIAVRQILTFIENVKNKDVLDYARENVSLRNELLKKDKIIDLMASQLVGLSIFDNDKDNIMILKTEEEVKKYFERKIEEAEKNIFKKE